MEIFLQKISEELKVEEKYVKNVVKLLKAENTVPFIARYRKEATGGMDEESLFMIEKKHQYYTNLEERKNKIIDKIKEEGKLTKELEKQIRECDKLITLEDIYLPFKSKKKTLASEAIKKGLKPLADEILNGKINNDTTLQNNAKKYINNNLDLSDVSFVYSGVKSIIAEQVVIKPEIREYIRKIYNKRGFVISKKSRKSKTKETKEKDTKEKETENKKRKKESEESKIQAHQTLALNRGEDQKELSVSIIVDPDNLVSDILGLFNLKNISKYDKTIKKLILDSVTSGYERLQKSICKSIRSDLTEIAEQHALSVFGHNLERILLTPPLGERKILAIDPGIRTGCKFAVLSEIGAVLKVGVFHSQSKEAKETIISLLEKHEVDLVVVGNGTAGRETEEMIAEIIETQKKSSKKVKFWSSIEHSIVSEAGASVYSVSDVAKEEFPDLDCTLRGTKVSIGRRVQNPLAEMIKVPSPSMGIEKELTRMVTNVVMTCVNRVGVDLNSASFSLLEKISGLNKSKARSIIDYREENGKFKSRKQILKVKGIGPKTYEQCIGFLRIKNGKNTLDNTNIHPEVYSKVEELLKNLKLDIDRLNDIEYRKTKFEKKLASVDKAECAEKLDIGLPTLELILENLLKPGLDPRDNLPKPQFRKGVLTIQNLKSGQQLTAVVRNVVDFGAFCDIGIKSDALLHVSQIPQCAKNKNNIFDVIKVGDILQVSISNIEKNRERVGISLFNNDDNNNNNNKNNNDKEKDEKRETKDKKEPTKEKRKERQTDEDNKGSKKKRLKKE